MRFTDPLPRGTKVRVMTLHSDVRGEVVDRQLGNNGWTYLIDPYPPDDTIGLLAANGSELEVCDE